MSKMLKVVGASWLQTKISSYILGFLGVLAILALFVGLMERVQEDGTYAATVFYSDKTGYRIEFWGQSNELATIPRGVARAYFRSDVATTGWSTLEVETNGSYPDEIQAYSAGIVEGALTWYLIHEHLENTIRARCDGQPIEKQCGRLADTLDRSVNNWKTYASGRGDDDPFWHQVSLYYTQIGGISTGWRHGVERAQKEYDTDISDLYWLNSFSEIAEIQNKLNISVQDPTFDRLPGLSSAFVRVVNETIDGTNTQKLFVAHNAAGSYSTMMRILKRYKLNYHLTSAKDSPPAPGVTVDFSGYPGAITSQDEFYAVQGDHHRLAITGTTLRNYNSKLWKEVNITMEVPIGPRLTAANHLATNVSTWGHHLARSNSGTGSKQWMVVDYAKFNIMTFNASQGRHRTIKVKEVAREISITGDTKHTVVHRSSGEGRAKGLFCLIEQVPGHTHSADLTDALLDRGFWATYGLPYFEDIAAATHTNKMYEEYPEIFFESLSLRANTFKQGFSNATSVENITKLMRHNNITVVEAARNKTDGCDEDNCIYEEDGYWADLGVRGDLVTKFREAYGVIDTKVVAGDTRAAKLEFFATSGPPFTEVFQVNQTELNKGNVASIYTDQFDDEPTIDGAEIRDLVKQQMEEKLRHTLAIKNKDATKPFKWSESDFKDHAPKALPDVWDFSTFKPQWVW